MHADVRRHRRLGAYGLRNVVARLAMGIWVVVPLLPAFGALLSWLVGLR